MKVRYSPLPQQFAEPERILAELRAVVAAGDFTLGKAVTEFEAAFAELIGTRFAVGVGSGTDALKLALAAIGIGPGDEVVTCANTFIATVGAINQLGARPRFVDCDDSFCMDVNQVEAALTPRARAIMPVHLAGDMVDMAPLMELAMHRQIPVVEDACQSLLASCDGRAAGAWGVAAGFSMHPLKLINVWGDAGIVVTDDADIDRTVRLLRNHGLRNRDEIEILGYNSRLDTVQAVVGKEMVARAPQIAADRRARAAYYDAGFAEIPQVRLPARNRRVTHTYLLYILFAERRDELLAYCLDRGIEAKIHYPIPLYQQDGLACYGHRPGDFPVTDRHAREMITFPVDQHLTAAEQDYVIATVRDFYAKRQS